jgi:predicted AAA+ superfamily ATPase
LAALLRGNKGEIQGDSTIQLVDYANEIVASGFPGIRELPNRARTLQLDGYLARIADVEFLEQGFRLAKPASLRSWMTAYAAATATTASYASILDAATPGDSEKPAKSTVLQYREMLNRLFLLDQVPGWIPALNPLSRLAQAPKHHLVDPALAARLLGLSVDALIKGEQGASSRLPDGALLGSLFESLVALCLRVYAQPLSASVHHLRTQNGDHEVDFIIEGDDRRVVAMEVKLSPIIEDRDVVHLKWLANKLGSKLADSVVVTTGKHAYRRPDGIAVVPAALLGP